MTQQTQRLQAAQYRLAQHYLDKLHTAQRAYQQGNESAAQALALFDRDREQVKQWQIWASTHASHDEKATAFCSDYAEASPDIFKLRLPYQEYLSWLEIALEAARRLGNHRAEVAHLLGLCATSELIFEYQHASDYAQQALSIARQIDYRPLMAHSLNLCGNTSRHQGNVAEAQAYFEQSLTLYQALGDRRGMAELCNKLGMLALFLWHNATAQDYLEQSLAHCQAISNQEMLAPCLNNLGFLAIRLGNYTAANDYLKQTLALCRLKGDKQGISVILSNLGEIAYFQEEYSLALSYLEQSLIIMRAIGYRELEAGCLLSLGQVTMAQKDLSLARGYFEQVLAFKGNIETDRSRLKSLSNLALIYLLLHQEDLAYAALREALEIARGVPSVHQALVKLQSLVVIARVWILTGKAEQAAMWLGLVENYPHSAVKVTHIHKDVQIARAECTATISPEQFIPAWEEGKTLNLDTVIAGILRDL